MTRKRYIKLIMSKGYSRNQANAAALMVQKYGQSYKSSWEQNQLRISINYSLKIVSRNLRKTSEGTEKAIEGFKNLAAILLAGGAANE